MTFRMLIASALLLVFASVAHAAAPNVVMIVSDDQAWTDFGFMGHKAIKTPRLDKLAAQSAVFPNGYVPTSLCRPSLGTMLTGLYPHQHKICCNDPPDGTDRALMHKFIIGQPTVPRVLQSLGYRSLQTGKLWDGHFRHAGFTDGMTVKGRHGDDGLTIGRKTMQPIYDFIVADTEKPFFVWYAPMLPHQPHNPPERLLAKYEQPGRDPAIAKYYAMCEWFDETCGELLEWLDTKKLSENTLVVFVVDNGWIQAPSGENKGRPAGFAPKSKRSPYDGGLRTPIMLRWPGHTKAGRYDDLVSTIDLMPTILSACGAKLPDGRPGVSLLDVAAGRGKLDRNAVFGEIHLHTAVDIEKPETSVTHRWVREGEWKLIVADAPPAPPELYHLTADPHEEANLAAKEPERVEWLRKLLATWWKPEK